MGHFIRHCIGGVERSFPPERFPELLEELASAPPGFRSFALTDSDTQWTLSVRPNGTVDFENLEELDVAPRHLKELAEEDVLRLLGLLVGQKFGELDAHPWLPGYAPRGR